MSDALENKQRALQKTGMNWIQKKFLKKVLGNMGLISRDMGCKITACVVNFKIADNNDVDMFITNTENPRTANVTAQAKAMQDEYPLAVEMVEGIKEQLKDLAAFWDTPENNLVFKAWTDGGKIKAEIRPEKGFPASEVITLS